jgi:hypothetical protein
MTEEKKPASQQHPAPTQPDRQVGAAGPVSQKRLGETKPEREVEPSMPYERDQSTGADSTADAASSNASSAPGNEHMRKAHDDVVSGRQDTDRGPVSDATYHELRKNGKQKP